MNFGFSSRVISTQPTTPTHSAQKRVRWRVTTLEAPFSLIIQKQKWQVCFFCPGTQFDYTGDIASTREATEFRGSIISLSNKPEMKMIYLNFFGCNCSNLMANQWFTISGHLIRIGPLSEPVSEPVLVSSEYIHHPITSHQLTGTVQCDAQQSVKWL